MDGHPWYLRKINHNKNKWKKISTTNVTENHLKILVDKKDHDMANGMEKNFKNMVNKSIKYHRNRRRITILKSRQTISTRKKRSRATWKEINLYKTKKKNRSRINSIWM